MDSQQVPRINWFPLGLAALGLGSYTVASHPELLGDWLSRFDPTMGLGPFMVSVASLAVIALWSVGAKHPFAIRFLVGGFMAAMIGTVASSILFGKGYDFGFTLAYMAGALVLFASFSAGFAAINHTLKWNLCLKRGLGDDLRWQLPMRFRISGLLWAMAISVPLCLILIDLNNPEQARASAPVFHLVLYVVCFAACVCFVAGLLMLPRQSCGRFRRYGLIGLMALLGSLPIAAAIRGMGRPESEVPLGLSLGTGLGMWVCLILALTIFIRVLKSAGYRLVSQVDCSK